MHTNHRDGSRGNRAHHSDKIMALTKEESKVIRRTNDRRAMRAVLRGADADGVLYAPALCGNPFNWD